MELRDTQRPYELTDSRRIQTLSIELRDTQPLYELTDNERTELPGTAARIASSEISLVTLLRLLLIMNRLDRRNGLKEI